MRRLGVTMLLVATACTSAPTPAPAFDPVLGRRLQEALEAARADHGITGASVAVSIAGTGTWTGVSGLADPEANRPVRTDTPFELASITKTYVAALALLLDEDPKGFAGASSGWISLDDPVQLPVAQGATLRQLLGHRGGLSPRFEYRGGPWTPAALGALMDPAVCEPGRCFAYSNPGYYAAALAMERATGKPIHALIRERLLERLDLEHTWFAGAEAVPGDMARPHGDDGEPLPIDEAERYAGEAWAGGAMVATASDLLSFAQALFGGELLAQESLNAMTEFDASSALPCPTREDCYRPYGIGLSGRSVAGHRTWGHEGGRGTALVHFPDAGVTMVVLTNAPGRAFAIVHALRREIGGLDDTANVFSIRADGTRVEQLTTHPALDGGPAWSPDGRRIAFGSLRDGDPEIYVMRADGSRQQRLTHDPADDVAPRWSPDGRIIFASDRAGNLDLYMMDADGSDVVRLTDDPAPEKLGVFSPGGSLIAYELGEEGARDIWMMHADGTGPRALLATEADEWHPAWSPDGSHIAFATGDGISVVRSDGRGARRISPADARDRFPAWGSTGRIAFTLRGDLWTMARDGSDRRRLTHTDEEEFGAWWSPDGRRVVYPAARP